MVRCKTWAKVSVQSLQSHVRALVCSISWKSVFVLGGEANRFCWKHLGGLPGPLGKSAWRDDPSWLLSRAPSLWTHAHTLVSWTEAQSRPIRIIFSNKCTSFLCIGLIQVRSWDVFLNVLSLIWWPLWLTVNLRAATSDGSVAITRGCRCGVTFLYQFLTLLVTLF